MIPDAWSVKLLKTESLTLDRVNSTELSAAK